MTVESQHRCLVAEELLRTRRIQLRDNVEEACTKGDGDEGAETVEAVGAALGVHSLSHLRDIDRLD